MKHSNNSARAKEIWDVLAPYYTQQSSLTPYRVIGSAKGVDWALGVLSNFGAKKPFFSTKRHYIAGCMLFNKANFVGMSMTIELKLKAANRDVYWFGDGEWKRQGSEDQDAFLKDIAEMGFDALDDLTDSGVVAQVDITRVYSRLKHLLDMPPFDFL